MEKQYQKFISHHPHFHSCGGTVSVMAHSLGSVLTYDLLHQTCEGKGISHAEPSPEPEYEAFPPFHSSSGEGGGGGSPSSPVKKSSSVELQDDASVKFTCNKNAEFSDSEEMCEFYWFWFCGFFCPMCVYIMYVRTYMYVYNWTLYMYVRMYVCILNVCTCVHVHVFCSIFWLAILEKCTENYGHAS